jgi:hypothetical protein
MRLIKDLMVLFIIPSDWWLTEQLTEHKFLDIVRLSKSPPVPVKPQHWQDRGTVAETILRHLSADLNRVDLD